MIYTRTAKEIKKIIDRHKLRKKYQQDLFQEVYEKEFKKIFLVSLKIS